MRISTLKFLIAFGLYSAFVTAVSAEPIAIIVNKANSLSGISYKDLVRTYRGYVSSWKDGQKVLLIHRNLNSQIRVDFFRKVLNAKNDRDFPGVKPSTPAVTIDIPSDEALLKFIAITPNAIGYIYAHNASDAVKVLKIDNYTPEQGGYPIK